MQNEEQMQAPVNPSLHSAFCIHHSAFPRSHRLSGKLLFAAVYDEKVKVSRGPLVVYSLPNELGHPRMGISISRKVGTAPRRNRIKRLLRESFRLNIAQLRNGYDLVIVVRPHEPMELGDYQRLLGELVSRSDGLWIKSRGVR